MEGMTKKALPFMTCRNVFGLLILLLLVIYIYGCYFSTPPDLQPINENPIINTNEIKTQMNMNNKNSRNNDNNKQSNKDDNNDDKNIQCFLFIAIFSSRMDLQQRQAARETWLRYPLPEGFSIQYKFIIGRPECGNQCDMVAFEEDVQINEESDINQDILKLDVLEGRVRSKSRMMWETFNWLHENVQSQYFLKTDHDTFLRLDLLVEELASQPVQKSFWTGFVWREETPVYSEGEAAFKLERLPPYTAGEVFCLSSEVAMGLTAAKPRVYLPDVGQSMALWLFPFHISPQHDPRFLIDDACVKTMISKNQVTPKTMQSLFSDSQKSHDPCASYSKSNCPLCFDCKPSQSHWRLKGLACDQNGAVKLKSNQSSDNNQSNLRFLHLLECSRGKLEDSETLQNMVLGGKPINIKKWRFSGDVAVHNSGVALVVRDSASSFASYITQDIDVGQTNAEAVVLSGWSKADDVKETNPGDYCLLADFTFSDGSKEHAVTVDFNPGTHDWEYNMRIFDPPLPIKQISLRCMLRVATGTVWFNNISVKKISHALCELKFQSKFFRTFRPAVLPDLSQHLHNRHTTKGSLPREAKFEVVQSRIGLLNIHGGPSDSKNSEVSADHTIFSSGAQFFVIWTSSADTFELRNRRAIESVFFHYPDAHVTVYSNELPLYFFHEFNSVGYDVQVVRYDVQKLAEGLPGASWAQDLQTWEKGDYFYSHLSDFLRFAILYRYGGIYTDLDSILLRPITENNLIVAEVCGSSGCSKDKDKTIKSKYYVPTGFMAFTAGQPLLLESLAAFDSEYDPSVRHCGSLYLSKAYSNYVDSSSPALNVTVLPVKAFYPIPETEIVKYFSQDNPERWQTIIQGEVYAFHFWGTTTRDTKVTKSSLLWRALTTFSISSQPDMRELQF